MKKEESKRINICMTEDFHERAKRYAYEKGMTFSELVRRALMNEMYRSEQKKG